MVLVASSPARAIAVFITFAFALVGLFLL